MSGRALAAGLAATLDDQEPVASAIPLTYSSNDAEGWFKPDKEPYRFPGGVTYNGWQNRAFQQLERGPQ